ncbi:hypothetical protein QE152_g29251 [Popillia japonica]|uniref:Uncharacterized protein n=1 Tax=Popillia japonica TaxID=7064 RepID=A0AAW1JIQ8_POPJA
MKLLITCLIITFMISGNAHPFLRNDLIKYQEKRSADNFEKDLSSTLKQVLALAVATGNQCLETAGLTTSDVEKMTQEEKNVNPKYLNATACIEAHGLHW